MLEIASWNVNGIRSVAKKGFMDWLKKSKFDVITLQEVRASEDQIPKDILEYAPLHKTWFAGEKKGYSGVAILSRKEPLKVWHGMDDQDFDVEGRVLSAEFKDIIVVTGYFPNSQEKGARIQYKLAYLKALEKWLAKLQKQNKLLVLNGDFNIAHQEIDLARPDTNHESPGFLPEEREWMTCFLNQGWIDTFRFQHPSTKDAYSWWSARTFARERNVGWRIDYNVIHEKFSSALISSGIQAKVMGSDHCPVTVKLDASL